MSFIKKHLALISLSAFYLILFLPSIGGVHLFDWDEINFAEAAREMLVTGDWFNIQINYEPFWEKPPLFIWLQAISFSIFGVSEFAARLPNVVIGLATIIVVFQLVMKRYGNQAAILSVLLYLGSLTPHFYFKSGIIDPLFNLFMFVSVWQFICAIEKSKVISFLWAGLFLGLAVLTKGPVALLLVGLTGLAYQIVYRNNFYSFKALIILLAGLLIPLGLYFGKQWQLNGSWFLTEFISYQIDLFQNPVASHGQPFFYHFLVLIFACFPLTLLAIPSLTAKFTVRGDATPLRWMKCLFWVVLIVFSLTTTKIVHYSSMCYLPLAVLGGVYFSQKESISKVLRGFIIAVGVALAFLFSAINYLGMTRASGFDNRGFLIEPNLWESYGFVFPFLFLSIIVWGMIKFNKLKLVSMLVGLTLTISFLLFYYVPRIEDGLQGKWIDHLKTYQGQQMMHFTQGFKSYAHLYYTKQPKLLYVNQAKQEVLLQNGFKDFLSMSRQDKTGYEVFVREYVINQTNIPISLSVKANKVKECRSNPKLKEVFHGGMYYVFERK